MGEEFTEGFFKWGFQKGTECTKQSQCLAIL